VLNRTRFCQGAGNHVLLHAHRAGGRAVSGLILQTVAGSRGWVKGINGPFHKFVVIGCFLFWLIGPVVWEDHVTPLVKWLFGVNDPTDVFVISVVPFLVVGAVLGWFLAPESSVWEAKHRKKGLADQKLLEGFADQRMNAPDDEHNPFRV